MLPAMYKMVFQNSKVALLFAIVTIMSAVSMVGTSEDSGLLLRVASLINGQRSHAAGPSDAPGQPGEAPPPPSVFGEYDASATSSASQVASAPPAYGNSYNPMTAPVSPGAVVVQNGTASIGADIPMAEQEVQPQ